jgi:hypothetical protein
MAVEGKADKVVVIGLNRNGTAQVVTFKNLVDFCHLGRMSG